MLLQAKEQCGHGKWEAWRSENLKLPSSTATLYQRVAEGWEVLTKCEDFENLTLKEAAKRLKKPRLNPQRVAEMQQPVVHQKDLGETLTRAQADFHRRKAAAEADYGSSRMPGLPEQRQTVPQEQIAAVTENGWIQTTDGQNLNPVHYRAESPVNTSDDLPNPVVTTESVNQHIWGLSEVHYAVRKFAAMNERQWDEKTCDEVAAAVLDFLAEY